MRTTRTSLATRRGTPLPDFCHLRFAKRCLAAARRDDDWHRRAAPSRHRRAEWREILSGPGPARRI